MFLYSFTKAFRARNLEHSGWGLFQARTAAFLFLNHDGAKPPHVEHSLGYRLSTRASLAMRSSSPGFISIQQSKLCSAFTEFRKCASKGAKDCSCPAHFARPYRRAPSCHSFPKAWAISWSVIRSPPRPMLNACALPFKSAAARAGFIILFHRGTITLSGPVRPQSRGWPRPVCVLYLKAQSSHL